MNLRPSGPQPEHRGATTLYDPEFAGISSARAALSFAQVGPWIGPQAFVARSDPPRPRRARDDGPGRAPEAKGRVFGRGERAQARADRAPRFPRDGGRSASRPTCTSRKQSRALVSVLASAPTGRAPHRLAEDLPSREEARCVWEEGRDRGGGLLDRSTPAHRRVERALDRPRRSMRTSGGRSSRKDRSAIARRNRARIGSVKLTSTSGTCRCPRAVSAQRKVLRACGDVVICSLFSTGERWARTSDPLFVGRRSVLRMTRVARAAHRVGGHSSQGDAARAGQL